VITLPLSDSTDRSISLVSVQIDGSDTENDFNSNEVVAILRDVYAELPRNNRLELDNDVTIEAVSPNWLINGLHHGPSTGGPGSRPLEAKPPDGDEWKFRPASLEEEASLQIKKVMGKKHEVQVAILDTAPSAHVLARAYHERTDHLLVQALFGPRGKLTVHHADPADLYPLMHYSPDKHHYWMPDHGTFSAGIIHSIAPEADLHLYEVLGPYGTGSYTSVVQGLKDAISDYQAGSASELIVNCSFMFSILHPEEAAQLGLPDELIKVITSKASHKALAKLFKLVTSSPDIKVVAAAGNDAIPGTRPPARYPAAFPKVMGVGALPKGFPRTAAGYKAARYSNFSDRPPRTGYMAFGGEAGIGQGVRGVYLSDFPDEGRGCLSALWQIFGQKDDEVKYRTNHTGWAWWAGTSFAAPIISGMLAGSSASGLLPARASTSVIAPFVTDQNEIVIPIQQG
jgi:hypothetical protein